MASGLGGSPGKWGDEVAAGPRAGTGIGGEWNRASSKAAVDWFAQFWF